MRKIFAVALALILCVGLSSSQVIVQDNLYRVPITLNLSDTIPGQQAGGGGHGTSGWLYVGSNGVEISVTCQDSMNVAYWVDYADTGYGSATGSSAKSVGFLTAAYTRGTAQDSLVAIANEANPKAMVSRVFRDRGAGTDVIPGARYIRVRFIAPNVASKLSQVSTCIVSLRVRQFRYKG